MSNALKMLSTPDLQALQAGDLSKVSTQGLQVLQREQMRTEMGLDPTNGGNNFVAGIGKGMASGMRALGMEGLVEKMGLPATKEEAATLDAPLDATTGGKVGQAVGLGALAAPAALVPGANTYAGSALLGSLTGAALTEGGLGDRAEGALYGALGGTVGKAAGDGLGAGANFLLNRRAGNMATQQLANAQRDAAASAAQGAGYVLPPADVKGGLVNEALNGLSGKIKTAQVASSRNQEVTNALVRRELGIPANSPLKIDTLNSVRSQAGKAYDAVESLGTITPGKTFTDALDKIVQPHVRAAKSFPNSKPNPIVAEIDTLRTGSFDAADAVAKIKGLRGEAESAYASGNKDLGKALKGGADALEQAIDDHLSALGPSKMLKDFRDARKLIAKTYTVQKGLNDATGDVSAQALAKQLEKGKPLSGDLKTIAQVGQAFPKATQALKEAPKAVSPLDYALSAITGTATGDPLGLATLAVRPAARGLILSGPYQHRMMTNTYGPGLLDRALLPALGSDPLRRGLLPLGAASGLLTSN